MQYREQVQNLDCGVSVIQMLHKYYYNQWISLATLKSNINYDQNGVNTLELSNLAEKFGMKLEVFQGKFESLFELELDEPIISIIKNEGFFHYVVIEKITNKHIIYCDPILGMRKITLEDFSEIYTEIVITCTKTSYIEIKEKKEISLYEFHFVKEMVWMSVVSIILVVLSFISTFYIKLLIDQIIPSQLKYELIIISLFFVLLMILKTLFSSLRSWSIHKIELKYNIMFLDKFINKINLVKWMKISSFDESMHLKNIELAINISSFKANYLFTSISQGFCLIFSTSILIWLDVNVFLVSLFCSSLIVAISVLFQKKFKNLEKENIKNSILFKKSIFNILSGIQQYKVSSINNLLNKNLKERIDSNVDLSFKEKNNDILYESIITIIKNMTPFVIVILATTKIWSNDLSIGELLLFMSIFSFFSEPLSTFTSMLIEIPITKQYVETLNSFYILEDENKNEQGSVVEKIETIKLEKLMFGFNEGKRIFNIKEFEVNQNMHFIGSNGCGKSTLLKIFATIINVDNISFNNKLIDYYNLDKLRKNICYISNNEFIPYSTIYQYLTCNIQSSINILLSNIDKYKLLNLFEKMNLSLHQVIDEYGKNISAGQKQFISLMKLFSSNYSLILLDEAFENLDEDIIELLFPILKDLLEDKIVIEVSHRKTYLFDAMEVNCERFK